MDRRLFFDIDPGHFAQQIDLTQDRNAIDELGYCCIDYLRIAVERPFQASQAPTLLHGLLRPSRVPAGQTYVMGIYPKPSLGKVEELGMKGVLYFMRPPFGSDTWYINLLLLCPAVRGRGLGTAVHQAFKRWAAARGGGRLLLAVSDRNPRAEHFWRDRIGYQETESIVWKQTGMKRKHRELEHHIQHVKASPWHAD